jgi:hypothetical protein
MPAKKTAPKSAKKQKKQPEVVVESESSDEEEHDTHIDAEVEEEEDQVPPGENEAQKERRLKASRINARKNARQRCYRTWAKKAGAGDANNAGELGNDILQPTLSISDVNRMATWCPENVEIGSSLDEFKLMIAQRDERLGASAAHVLRANVEGLARNVMLELVDRSIETGPSTITAAHVRSLLRPYEKALEVSSIASDGLIRFGQLMKKTVVVRKMTPDGPKNVVEELEESILAMNDEDEDAIGSERKFAKANHIRVLKEADKERDARRAAKKATRAASKAAAPIAA